MPDSEFNFRDDNRVVTYSISPNEGVTEALLNAFYTANVDIDGGDEMLMDQIEADGLNRLIEESTQNVRVTTQLWDHTVVIRPEEVTIYNSPAR
jgi:transcription antitermination factor NusA-like protein